MDTKVELKAFVGHSFADRDEDLTNKIIRHIEGYDILCKTGEKAQNKSVSQKVRERIDECDLFVGIFTKGMELCGEILDKGILARFCKNKASRSDLFMTSNWVIQESGYALGKGKSLLLMVEKGIYNFPELQGDQEVVPFDRSDINAALVRLSDMLYEIKLKYYQPKPAQAATAPPSADVEADAKGKEQEKRESEAHPFKAFFEAVDNKDVKQMNSLYNDRIRNTLKEDEKEFWDAAVLKFKYSAGDADALAKLQELSKQTKNSDVLTQLAQCYEFGDKQKDAIRTYEQAIGLCESDDDRVSCVTRIAICSGRLEGTANAIEYLLSEIKKHPSYGKSEDIFKSLANHAKKLGDDYLYVVFCEQLLTVNPVNTEFRFSLAYKYSETGQEKLAVHHYTKYLTITNDPVALNNLAVAYDSLGMKSKAVESYKESKEKETTLAMSNLANKYLNEGFIEEAQLLLKSAEDLSAKGVEVHQNIGIARKRIKELLEEEGKKEKELLTEADKTHRFRANHANSYCVPSDTPPTGKQVKTCVLEKWGSVPITLDFDAGRIEGTFQTRLDDTDLFLAAFLSARRLGGASGLGETKQYKIREVRILGDFKNLAGQYSLKVTETKESEGAKPEEVFNATGLFVIKQDLSSVDVLQEVKENQALLSWPLSG